ncbi:MAG: AAA family ATPase [Deltaproteobacteria bacterium]|nr:AAA family ATPase [Deltaproteobacteria bacterium]MBW1912491.1 AAA family ATPase [Deltaproteobacteria bacterium]
MEIDNIEEKNNTGKLPDQQELEKELSDYLSKKYGNRIKIISPFLFPKGQEVLTDDGDPVEDKKKSVPSFDLLPEDLDAYLDSFIVKQNQAKAVLSTKICTHFNRVKYLEKFSGKKKTVGVGMIKNNVLMIGPTGVGKTYMIKLIAQKLGVPLVKGDATKFSETGYVGGDVEDLVRDLLYEADDDIGLAENGIIYIDEIDKIASARNIIGHDVSRTGVQRTLLKPMEETDVDLKVPHDPISQIQAIEHYRRTGKKEKKVVNTRNILFIMSGAFGDLADIIKKRLQRQGIGFEADVRSTEVPWEIIKEVTAQDLIEFGFESEFVGRLPVVAVFDELTKEDLVEILKNPNNPIIVSKRQDFRAYGIDIKFEDEALIKIAEIAADEKTGARGLVSAIERVLIPFEKNLPSTEIKRLLVTPEVVDNPKAELLALKESHDDPERSARFELVAEQEIEDIVEFIASRRDDFRQMSGLDIHRERSKIIAEIYLKMTSDINTAFEDFIHMFKEIKKEEALLAERLEVNLRFDDSAIDELIRQSVESDQEVGPLTFYLAKKLEYGLKLVRDRAGIDEFVINADAVIDMDHYVNDLVKRHYRNSSSMSLQNDDEDAGFTVE